MENAAKALLMAGGILIALLVMGALVLLFSNLSDYQNKTDASVKQSQIAEFNNQFEPYNRNDVTLMELKSLYNKILSNNAKSEYKIDTNILSIYPNINADFLDIDEDEKIHRRFKCINIKYENADGRISKIEFEDVTPPYEPRG